MRSTELAQRLKEATGAKNNDEVLDLVSKALAPQTPIRPVGVTLVIAPTSTAEGPYPFWPTLMGNRLTIREMKAIQAACRIFANDLEPDIQEMQEREIEARIRKQLEGGGSAGL